jgi:hypothetical protein
MPKTKTIEIMAGTRRRFLKLLGIAAATVPIASIGAKAASQPALGDLASIDLASIDLASVKYTAPAMPPVRARIIIERAGPKRRLT